MAGPRVTKSGRKLIVTHEFPHRLYCSLVYPYPSSNGSTVIVTGTDRGLHIAWHGGKPLYFTSSSEGPIAGGHAQQERNDDDVHLSDQAESDDEALFDSEQDELDDDQPCPPVVQDLEIPFSSPVLHIAAPALSDTITARSNHSIFTRSIVLAIACADGEARVISVPLEPPSAATKRKKRLGVRICSLRHGQDQTLLLRGIAIAVLASDVDNHISDTQKPRTRSRSSHSESQMPSRYSLLISRVDSTLAAQLLSYRVPCPIEQDYEVLSTADADPISKIHIPSHSTALAFDTQRIASDGDSLRMLVASINGSLQVRDAIDHSPLRTFHAGFDTSKHTANAHPGLAHRKKILDAAWVFDGRAIFVLLEDGEWGVWIVDEADFKADNDYQTSSAGFALRGFVGDAPEPVSNGGKLGSKPDLAPVTPNTRRVRQETLFKGPTQRAVLAPRGGISVVSTTLLTDVDDSIVMWYGASVHVIPSLRTIWSRTISSHGKDTGTLYGPGISRIDDLDLNNEQINSVCGLPGNQREIASSTLSSVAQRDLLVTTEHRLILLSYNRPQLPAQNPTKQQLNELPDSQLQSRDQMLLVQGDLDLGGMDRLLDSMVGTEDMAPRLPLKTKRVGFAS